MNPAHVYEVRPRKRIKLPDGQSWFAVFELVRVLGVRRERIMELIDEGELLGAVDIRSRGASRACIRVPRESVIDALENGSIHTHAKKTQMVRIMNRRGA